MKHYGRHEARIVAYGVLTEVFLPSIYSGVVLLRGIRLVLLLVELNGIESWETNAGSDYLEEFTKEKVCIVARPEFGSLEGYTLIIKKSLCMLRTSGLLWHERLAFLRDMVFKSCKMKPDM